ncbi:MAG: hypothetical protein ACYTFX_12710 [Planctomycetota bacterium]
MTTPAATAKKITGTIQGTYTAHTSTLASIAVQGGTLSTGLSHSALDVIDDLLTSLLNGQTSSEGSWAIQITIMPSDSRGRLESIQRQKEKKSKSTTKKKKKEWLPCEHLGNVDIYR